MRTSGLEHLVRFPSPPGEPQDVSATEGSPGSIVVEPADVSVAPTCAALKDKGDLADYVILCVKTWQVSDAARDAASLLRPGTGCMVTTQNGFAAPEQAASSAGSEAAVLVGIAKVIAFREDPASGPLRCVRLAAPAPKTLMLGELVRAGSCESARVRELRDILHAAGLDVPLPEDGNIRRELWRKATMMCCMGPMSAVTRADIHTMVRSARASALLLLPVLWQVCVVSKPYSPNPKP